MHSNLANCSSISSVSNSTLTSIDSTENLLFAPCGQIDTSLVFKNDLVNGSRLEMLQQIASRVQRDCVAGEDKLVLARNALQSDAKRLESGVQFQNEAEIAGYLLECESLLRQQVVDIQILLDGKFYLADQLVQRVSKIRDDLLALKSECSSVYSKGRTLTTEQTKMMISGITQSLNSGFSQNMNSGLNTGLSQGLTPTLTPGLMPGLSPGLTSSFTSSLTPCLTPSLTPAMTPGLQPTSVQSYVTGMDSAALQALKLMQIRKPLMKSSLADPNLTEEEVNMSFVQDLLNWVEEMQVQLDRSEWGSDLPTVETHLENHKSVHRAIEEFQMSLKEAKYSEIQMTSAQKHNYSEKLSRLENQYGKLLNSSRNRQKYLESLQEFVSRATWELIWLNEKEEEEVAYDWSDRNSNMAKKRDYHADLMRELDEKERVIKSVQDMAERLLLENHPARLTIEAYRAAMQTQWGWILQLCGCVEQHLNENTVYFEFFNDAKESMDYLKNLQDTIQRKYGCDRTSSLHKLEDLVQESMDEKEQLLQYRSTVASLVGRAKGIVQLKPRNPDGTIRNSLPVQAICDYRQIEITIYKEDECILANNSYRAKWKVISPTGNEAMVPSVCFTIPPPNNEAIETVSRIEQLYQNVLTLWHHSHINMKSVVSWHYLMNDIEAIQNGNVASIKTMLPGEHQQVLSNLQSHLESFLEDSQESEVFTVSDRGQLEREVVICKQYYEDLLKSAEREEHEESVYNLFISEVRNFRMRLENYEERLIRWLRAPLERDDLQESVRRIAEQEKSKKELDRLKEDLETMQEKCEVFVSQAASSPSVPTLSSELNVVVQNMNQVYSMSSIYLEKLKTVSLVVKNTQGAEALVKLYEAKLCEEDAVNADTKAIETVMSTLKLWRTEIDEKREVFHALEDELQKARAVSDRMFKMHNERDFDLDWHKEKADQLAERWQNVHSQIENRLRDLECICKSLKYYKDTYEPLDDWIKEMEDTQRKMQENQPEDSKALAELLNQQKLLVSEIEMKQSKIDECQKYSEQYSASVKDYELQLMTYRAMVGSQQKSPVKRRRIQSSSDVIIQEFMDLRTRYTALVTLMTQYVKFASDTLKRTEEEEKRKAVRVADQSTWSENMEQQKAVNDNEIINLRQRLRELEYALEQIKKQKDQLEQELPRVIAAAENELKKQRNIIDDITLQKTKVEYEAKQYRLELETTVKKKAAAEQELERARQLTLQSESKKEAVEQKLRVLKKEIEDNTMARRKMEEHLRRKDTDVQDLEMQKRTLEMELKTKESSEEHLLRQIKQLEQSWKNQSESRMLLDENRYSVIRESVQQSAFPNNGQYLNSDMEIVFKKEQELKKVEVLQQKVDDLTVGKQKVENDIQNLKSELNSIQLQKNASDEKAQLFKDRLDESNNKLKHLQLELQQRSSSESSYVQNFREMESGLLNSKQQAEQFRQESNQLKKSIYHLQEDMKSLQRENTSFEQEVQFYKTEVEGLKEQLKIQHNSLLQRNNSEQESSQKTKYLEQKLTNSQAEVDQLKFKVNELSRTNTKSETELINLKLQIDSLQQEKVFFEQKLQSQIGEAGSLRELLAKAKEEISLKTKAQQEIQSKSRNLESELEKRNILVNQLKEKVEELKRMNNETERSMTNLKVEIDKLNLENSSKQQQSQIFKSQVDSLKSQSKILEEELLKKNKAAQEFQLKLRNYDDEMKKAAELQQKMKGLSMTNISSERDIRKLKSELSSANMAKKLADQKVQAQKVEIDDLNVRLKNAEEELKRETAAVQKTQSKLKELETELQKCKLASEVEILALQKEKSTAQEKVRSQTAEVILLKQRLEKAQEELKQRQKEEITSKEKATNLEEGLGKCREMVEDLKIKLDIQKKGHEQQLQLLQGEMEQKMKLQESAVKLEFDKKSREQSYSTETSERENKYLRQEIEQLKAFNQNILKNKLETQKELDMLLLKVGQAEKEKTAAKHELQNSKTHISQLENEKIKLKASVSQADNIRKEMSMENTKLKQSLAEREREQALVEQEAKLLREQIASSRKEVSSLKEKLSKIEAAVCAESRKVNEMVTRQQNQKSQQDSKELVLRKKADSEIESLRKLAESEKAKRDLLTKELQITKKLATSNEETKKKLEEELRMIKFSSEMAKVEQTDEIRKLKLEKESILNETEMLKNIRRDFDGEFKNLEKSYSVQNSQSIPILSQHTDIHHVISQKDFAVQRQTTSKSDLGNSVRMEMTSNNGDLFSVHHLAMLGASKALQSQGNTFKQMDWSQNWNEEKWKFQGLRYYVNARQLVEATLLESDTVKKLELGLLTVDEVQKSLERFISKKSAIAGLYLDSSKKKMTLMDAANKGFIAKSYALEFLEAQAATGFIIDPMSGNAYTVEEALQKGAVEDDNKVKLVDAEKSVTGYLHAGKTLSVFQAIENRILERQKGKKIIEAQIATGGVIDPQRSIRLPAEIAVNQGFLNSVTLKHLYEPGSNPRGFHNPNTGQAMYYSELIPMCVYDIDGGVLLLPIGDRHVSSSSPAKGHRVSVIDSSIGTEMTAYEAYRNQHIDKKMYLELSEQECEWKETAITDSAGVSIQYVTDFKSGRQFNIEDALRQGLINQTELTKYKEGKLAITELADLLISRHIKPKVDNSPIAGIWDAFSNKRLSIYKALQQNLVERFTAIRLLEAQACTGGIYDPSTGKKCLISEALEKGLLDEALARQIQQSEHAYTGIVDPQSKVTLSLTEAMKMNLFTKDVGFRCLEFQCLTGGLIEADSSNRVPISEAVRRGIIDTATALKLQDEKYHTRSLTCPKTKRKISFKDALDRAVFDHHTGLRLLEAFKPQGVGASTSRYYIWSY
ncbi:plectin-like isoform X15 [Polyodon spathula]|uniref:plectin-like isoform X15 n=1 Tax=Polyodon spathula TaxID=7913 RepID=UPI001B7EC4C6|nr:plectin-like isoform X15 [Polyodon spathula]